MALVQTSFYTQCRLNCGIASVLHEDCDSPPERLLQAVWQHQRLRREELKTVAGQPLRVLHPGFLSHQGGPDFRGAVLQFGADAPVTGDVEIDLRSRGWRAHGHDRNPAFESVLLHVIWEVEKPSSLRPPTLALHPVLDASIGELSLWLSTEPPGELPEGSRGRCSPTLRSLPSDVLQDLLRQAARVRLEAKAAAFRARARHAGWEQALWEGLFRALGYRNNQWPMQRIAELRPAWSAQGAPLALQARLLGVGSLLPGELPRGDPEARQYARALWDQWWRERDQFSDCLLPRGLWRLHGVRPANHPQRRLVLGAAWVARGGIVPALEGWCGTEIPESHLAASLLRILEVEADEFWGWHFTLRSPRLHQRQPLLGASRVTDIAVNIVIPWLWAWSIETNNGRLKREAERRYFGWPASQDNAVLKLARKRLLGSLRGLPLSTAAAQQGLLQIVRDFCDHSNAVCTHCKFPETAAQCCGQ